ncbi:hypothetical protein CI793_12030 [Anoxybacillus ayderensis]|nr:MULTISPECIES: hypothetical protein [Anoxybacillus]AXM88071.1 hypothetical protein B379_02105 [Anoxybacillus ayderensis G10]MBW9217216.1 hypothetical protein [Anoxybacillus sp. ST70]NNU95299.1 hypothetical protein [Anoxybacillus sp. EFIL]THD15618.1 hypothetical protein CI793_12030 [Anoxybacillus ayderensis]
MFVKKNTKREGVKMKGLAILFEENHTVTILEDVEKEQLEEVADEETEAVLWHDEEIDWDYGY